MRNRENEPARARARARDREKDRERGKRWFYSREMRESVAIVFPSGVRGEEEESYRIWYVNYSRVYPIALRESALDFSRGAFGKPQRRSGESSETVSSEDPSRVPSIVPN